MSPNQADFEALAALEDPEAEHARWLLYIMNRAAGIVPAGTFGEMIARD